MPLGGYRGISWHYMDHLCAYIHGIALAAARQVHSPPLGGKERQRRRRQVAFRLVGASERRRAVPRRIHSAACGDHPRPRWSYSAVGRGVWCKSERPRLFRAEAETLLCPLGRVSPRPAAASASATRLRETWPTRADGPPRKSGRWEFRRRKFGRDFPVSRIVAGRRKPPESVVGSLRRLRVDASAARTAAGGPSPPGHRLQFVSRFCARCP